MERLKAELLKRGEISFSYLHGTFAGGERFRDIDIAIYLGKKIPDNLVDYELDLETTLMLSTGGCPVDVRALNEAPLSFRYQVIKEGVLLFARSDDERADFQESTLSAYFDFAPYRELYLRETLGHGV